MCVHVHVHVHMCTQMCVHACVRIVDAGGCVWVDPGALSGGKPVVSERLVMMSERLVMVSE